MARKAISKKVRFEVFKRDGFKCMYCGAHPPGVLLHVDHIDPVALGGKNDIDNLITACEPCNLGKSATPLTSVPQALSDKAAETREREEQIQGYQAVMADKRVRLEDDSWTVAEVHMGHFDTDTFPKDWRQSIKHFVDLLGLHECITAMESAVSKKSHSRDGSWRYFCGICWNKARAQAEGGR